MWPHSCARRCCLAHPYPYVVHRVRHFLPSRRVRPSARAACHERPRRHPKTKNGADRSRRRSLSRYAERPLLLVLELGVDDVVVLGLGLRSLATATTTTGVVPAGLLVHGL